MSMCKQSQSQMSKEVCLTLMIYFTRKSRDIVQNNTMFPLSEQILSFASDDYLYCISLEL